jgi:hypothetical protein
LEAKQTCRIQPRSVAVGREFRLQVGVLQNRILLAGVHGILAAALVVGCGGGEALSRAQYVAKLSAMCEDFSAREEVIGEPQTLADLVEKGPRILAAFEKAIADRVGTLKAPDEIVDQAGRLIDLAAQQRDVLADLVDAAENSDVAKVQQLVSKNDALNKEADSITRELGAEGCVG